MTAGVRIGRAFSDAERPRAAALFWEAFAAKLAVPLGPEPRALRYLAAAFQPGRALCARDGRGKLVGLAGVHVSAGGLVGGTISDLAAVYGWAGALWRGPLLDLLERRPPAGTLLMEGLVVDPDLRGQGIGTALLSAVVAEAEALGLDVVRLDVVEGNDRARALYRRHGFEPVGRTTVGPLRHVFGFGFVESMVRPVGGAR